MSQIEKQYGDYFPSAEREQLRAELVAATKQIEKMGKALTKVLANAEVLAGECKLNPTAYIREIREAVKESLPSETKHEPTG